MKKTMLTIVAIMVAFFTMTAYAGETAAPQELSKKELKELEKKKKMMEDSAAHADAAKALKEGSYILIVDKLYPLNVSPNNTKVNFVIVDQGKFTMQTGREKAFGGNNHLGGITITAAIKDNVKTEEKKNGEVKSQFSVTDEYLAGKVSVKLDKKDNYGEVTLIELKSGTDVTFAGHILPYSASMVESGAIQMGKSFIPDPLQGFGKGSKSDATVIMNFLNGSKF